MKRWREGRRDKEKGGGMETGMKDGGRDNACVCTHVGIMHPNEGNKKT